MMTPISSATQTSVVQPADTFVRVKPREEAIEPIRAEKTKVTISPAARSAAAAADEATETPAVSAREAQNGDRQAQARVARLAAEKLALHQA